MWWLLCIIVLSDTSAQIAVPNTRINLELYEFAMWFFENVSCVNIISSTHDCGKMLIYNKASLKHSFKIFNRSNPVKEMRVSEGFLIISNNSAEVREILMNFEDYSYKSNAVFMVFLFKAAHEAIFRLNLKLRLQNFVIILGATQVLHYAPFTNNVNVFNISDRVGIKNAFFDDDFHGRVIKCTLFGSPPAVIHDGTQFTGIDPIVFRTMAQKLNFTLEHHDPYDGNGYGSMDASGKATGSILELHTGQADVTCNQIFLKNYNAPHLRFTSTIFNDKLCVVVPRAKRKPRWMALLGVFRPAIWMLIEFTIVCFIFCLVFIRKFKSYIENDVKGHRHSNNANVLVALVDIIQIIYSAPHNNNFSNHYFERIFQGVVLLFSLIITAIFQGSLLNLVRNPQYYPNINTLQELDESGYTITTFSSSLKDTFAGSNLPYIQSLDKKLKVLGRNDTIGTAYLAKSSKVFFNRMLNYTSADDHQVKECTNDYLLSYITHRDAIFNDDMSRMLDRILASGLANKWREEVYFNLTLNLYKREFDVRVKNFPTGFTLQDVQSSFYVLVIGLVISVFVFLIEIYQEMYCKK